MELHSVNLKLVQSPCMDRLTAIVETKNQMVQSTIKPCLFIGASTFSVT